MGSRPRIDIGVGVVIAALAIAFLIKAMNSAQAAEAPPEEFAAVPCAVVTEYDGEAELLDSSRVHLLPLEKKTGIPCGGWVTVTQGAIELRHRDGFRIHLAKGSFAQFPEPNLDGRSLGDQLVLFRGEAYAQAGGGSGELRILTTNARARVSRGSALLIFNGVQEETQLVAIENSASIENRFESSRKISLKPGEASSLSFKLLRVVPSAPRAVSVAMLRPRFDSLRIPERERRFAIQNAKARGDRGLASILVEEVSHGPETLGVKPLHGTLSHTAGPKTGTGEPSAASSEIKIKRPPLAPDPGLYGRNENPEEADQLNRHRADRLLAGQTDEAGLLHPRVPSKSKGRRQSARQAKRAVKSQAKDVEGTEKRRLIEELSKIREDD